MTRHSGLLLLLVLMLPVTEAVAQFNYGGGSRSARSAGPMLALVDFSFEPSQAPDASFSFSNPAYGLFYSRQGFAFRMMRGSEDLADGTELVLVEGQMQAFGALRPFANQDDASIDLFFPVGIHGDFRRVRKSGGDVDGTVFEVTVMAATTGIGLTAPVGKSDLSIRSMPFFGVASRSFGNDTGTSAGFSADVEWASPDLRGRFGFYAGWSYRWQRWLLNAATVIATPESQNVEYRGSMHAIQVGLTF